MNPRLHQIRLKADGAVIDDLEIEDVSEGNRDKQRNLVDEGGVLFRSPRRKLWFLKFSEFSFLINHVAKPKAESEVAAA